MYDVGDIAELTLVFKRLGTPTDQASVEMAVKAPDGMISTPAATHTGEDGTYLVSIPLTQAGTWAWRAESANAAEEGVLRVSGSRLP